MSYTWNFNDVFQHPQALMNGTIITLELTAVTILIGTVAGFVFYLAKRNHNTLIRKFSSSLIEILRSVPILVLIIWTFYSITPLMGINIDAFWASAIAMSLVLAAFCSEIFRAGFESVERGQIEAGKVLGFSEIQILRFIVLPQALKTIIPPLTGRYIETVKLTSLASVIAVNELLHAGNTLISFSYRPLEVYTIIAMIHLAIILPLGQLLKKVEGM